MMKNVTTWGLRLLPWLLAALVLCLHLPSAAALDDAAAALEEPQDAISMADFSLEIIAEGVSYTIVNAAQGYTLCMNGEEGGFLYGFYRRNLDWSQQAGVSIALANDSTADLRLVLMLVDASWQNIEIPDGTAVFLQETGSEDVVVVFSDESAITVPAGFSGQVQVPVIADDEILSNLEGLGFTFVPQGAAILTLSSVAFWSNATAAHYQSLGALGISLADTTLLIPQTGYSMTSIALQGVSTTNTVVYLVADAPTGITVDEAGRIWVDATAEVGTVMVQAVVDGTYVLGTTFALTSVWDVKPEELSLAEFTILDPPGNAKPIYVQVFLWWIDRLPLLRTICILLAVILPCIYIRWRIDKPP